MAKCHQLTLLSKVFGEIHLPEAVLREVTGNSALPGALAVAEFVRESGRVHPDKNDEYYRDFRIVPLFGLLGVLLEAKRLGFIEAVSPIVNHLLAHDYRLSASGCGGFR